MDLIINKVGTDSRKARCDIQGLVNESNGWLIEWNDWLRRKPSLDINEICKSLLQPNLKLYFKLVLKWLFQKLTQFFSIYSIKPHRLWHLFGKMTNIKHQHIYNIWESSKWALQYSRKFSKKILVFKFLIAKFTFLCIMYQFQSLVGNYLILKQHAHQKKHVTILNKKMQNSRIVQSYSQSSRGLYLGKDLS